MERNAPSTEEASALRTGPESNGDLGARPAKIPIAPGPHAVIEECLGFKPKYLDHEWQYEGRPKTKFNEDHPPDAWGEEATPNARVWKIYRDNHIAADKAMLESWNKTLDVLLIFAGLFSAVSTAFIVESYKALQPDYTRYIANVLYAAAVSNQTVGGIVRLPHFDSIPSPDSFVDPSATERWTNGMWFSSLVVSLAVALLCILIKQWLDEYERHIMRIAPSPKHWARRHQLHSRGLTTWGVPVLISLLPLLLHVSLFLFFTGLVLFLQPLDDAIANTLLTMVAFVLLFYILSLVMPAWRLECPSYTQLLAQARSVVTFGLRMIYFLFSRPQSCVYFCFPYGGGRFRRFLVPHSVTHSIRNTSRRAEWALLVLLDRSTNLLAREASALNAQKFDLDGWALSTLFSSADSDTFNAGIEALSAVSAGRTLDIVSSNAWIISNRMAPVLQSPLVVNSSGFAIMTYARFMRVFPMTRRWEFTINFRFHGPDLSTFFGIDGMLLLVMGAQFQDYFDMRHLVTLLQRHLSSQVDNPSSAEMVRLFPRGRASDRVPHSNDMPHRMICLRFLASLDATRFDRTDSMCISCALLVLCAGQFHLGDVDERIIAMRSVLHWQGRLMDDGRDDDLTFLNGLYALLTNPVQRSVESETRPIFVHHLGLLCRSISECSPNRSVQWSRLPDFSLYVRSPEFEQHLSYEVLAGCMTLLAHVDLYNFWDVQESKEYFFCTAKLLRFSCEVGKSAVPCPPEALYLVRHFYAD